MSMPALNRRRLLVGLAAASTAATVASVPALAPAKAPTENAELIRLGDLLPATSAAYLADRAAFEAVLAEWAPRWPVAPDAIAYPAPAYEDRETTLDGYWLILPGQDNPRGVIPAARLRSDVASIRKALARKRRDIFAPFGCYVSTENGYFARVRDEWEIHLADLSAKLALATAYEAERARVREASGFDAARSRLNASRDALKRLVRSIMAERPNAMPGVLVQAQALAAWGGLERLHRAFDSDLVTVSTWGPSLGAAVLRIAGEVDA